MRIQTQPRQNSNGQRVAAPSAKDDNVAVGKIDELQDAIDHRIAQRNERVQASDGQSSDKGLNEVRHQKTGLEEFTQRSQLFAKWS